MNPNDSVLHKLNPPVRARYIRFLHKEWEERISMRVELYGCTGYLFLYFSFLLSDKLRTVV